MDNVYSDVAIVGCGGVGGYLALPLMRYLESCNYSRHPTIRFIDGDKFEKNNLKRQVCSQKSIGVNKARWLASLCSVIKQKETNIKVYEEYLTEDNIDRILDDTDAIFLCVDNNATRKLVDDWFSENHNDYRLLINGGNEVEEGNVQIVYDGVERLCETHPEIRNPSDVNPGVSCVEQAFSSPQISVANMMVASLMLMQFYRGCSPFGPDMRCRHEVFFDVGKGEFSGYDRWKNMLE